MCLAPWCADMKYKICRASMKYSGPYEFLKGRATKSEDIDVTTPGNEEMRNMREILDVAIERGCSKVNGQLIVTGPREELHDDLIQSLRENGLFVTGGQFYSYYGDRDWLLEFFVTETPAVGAG